MKLSILLLGVLMVFSCAHKSGHLGQKQTSAYQQKESHSLSSTREDVPIVRAIRSSGEKMEGYQVFSLYHSAVFMIYTTDGSRTYQGSGFFIDTNGLAVSNYHVFQGTGMGMESIKLDKDDNNYYKVSEVYHKSSENDFILFRVNCGKTNCIPIANRKPNIGEKVFAIGSPRGLENTFSSGDVSQWRDTNLMQISALIDHGSSGGALINEYGEVVGITSGTFADGSQANLNYAWSIDVIKPYIDLK